MNFQRKLRSSRWKRKL